MSNDQDATEDRRLWGGYAWLPLVTPVDAVRFWTDAAPLASTLRSAGGAIDGASPDVEVLTNVRNRRARAPRVVTCLSISPADRGPWIVRRTTRATRSLRLRTDAIRLSHRLRSEGYQNIAEASWETEGAYVPWLAGWRRPRTLADVLPENLLVVADRGSRSPSLLESALARAAACRPGGALEIERLLVRDTSVVVLDSVGVLRIELGAAGSGVERQVQVLRRVRALPAIEADGRAPRVLGYGTVGLAAWSLEERLAGTALRDELAGDGLTRQCVDFLVTLAGAWRGPVAEDLLMDDLHVVTTASHGLDAELHSLVRWIFSVVSRQPGQLAHGDFFGRNILVDHGELTGVVDWERSAVGRAAMHDVVHLGITGQAGGTHVGYGPAAVAWAEAADVWRSNGVLASYCARLDIEPDEQFVVAVAASCWLAQVAHQLTRVADNGSNAAWVDANVTRPARAFRRLARA